MSLDLMTSIPPSRPQLPAQPLICHACRAEVDPLAIRCRHCGEDFQRVQKCNVTAGCLGFALGPVGLWYKGQWGAGFAWLTMIVIVILATGGIGGSVGSPILDRDGDPRWHGDDEELSNL